MIEIRATNRSVVRSQIGKTVAWIGLLASVAAISLYAAEHHYRGLGLAGGVLVASIVAVRTRGASLATSSGWIPPAWIALLLVADHRFDFTARSPLDAAYGNASTENVVQVLVYALVAAMVVRSRHILLRQNPRKIAKVPILLFPLFALASATWSPIALFTVVRATQLLVIVSLALLTVRIWQSSPQSGESIWRDGLRLFVQVVSILSVVGLILQVWPNDRFAWPGIHPGAAAIYTGAALLILIVGGRSFVPPPRWAYWPRLCLLAAVIYLGQTRNVLAALAFAGLVALWAAGTAKPLARYLGIWYYGIGALLLFLFARLQVVDYLSRGEGADSFVTLNGRIPLWELAIGELSQADKWLAGFGYGASRILLYPEVPWAGTAHNSWIEVLIGVGIVGAFLLLLDILFLVGRLGWGDSTGSTRLALVMLAFLLVVSGASETLVLPGIGFGLFALIHCPALGERKRGPRGQTLPEAIRSPAGDLQTGPRHPTVVPGRRGT